MRYGLLSYDVLGMPPVSLRQLHVVSLVEPISHQIETVQERVELHRSKHMRLPLRLQSRTLKASIGQMSNLAQPSALNRVAPE